MPDVFDQIHVSQQQPAGDVFDQVHAGSPPSATAKPEEVRAWLDKRYPEPAREEPGNPIGNFLKGAVVNTWKGLWDIGKRIVSGPRDTSDQVASALAGPLGPLIKDIAQAHLATAKKAIGATKEGDALSAAGYGLAAALPAVGPQAAAIGEKVGSGRVAEGAGEATALLAPAALAELKLPASVRVTPRLRNPNPAEAAAVDWALKRNPKLLDAGAATGNVYVKGIQWLADHSPVGAYVSGKAKAAQAAAFTEEGQNLAVRTYPDAVVPEQAGEAVRGALTGKISRFKSIEDRAYDRFREIEAQPENLKTVTVGNAVSPDAVAALDNLSLSQAGKRYEKLSAQQQQSVLSLAKQIGIDVGGKPVTEQIPLPVDMRPIKSQLKPLYDRMGMWLEPAKRNASAGYQAVKSILEGPDYMQASIAEEGLSGLKKLAREAKSPDLRDVNSGTAALAVKQLQQAIDGTVAQAGPGTASALKQGRSAHAAKMGISDVLDQLRDEPVQVFDQAIWQKDSGIQRLRKVAALAPAEMPKIGRAYLEDLLNTATAEGAFDKTRGLSARWQQLGPRTKQILFGSPALISDLDKFFLLAKKAMESPNPSGSALVGSIAMPFASGYVFHEPISAATYLIGTGAVSKLLHSPKGIRALMEGMKVPLSNKPAAAIAAGNLLKIAGSDAKPFSRPAEQIGPGATPPGQ